MPPKITIKTIFNALQSQMREKLSGGREIIFHPTEKGDYSEINWIEWLRSYLPKRYAVDKAFVIDSEDTFSDQLDLVIYDQQYSPFVFREQETLYIPAESVYAVFEVKQTLNAGIIDYAHNKIQSVRKLKRTSKSVIHAGGVINTPKAPFEILGGTLTLTSEYSPPFSDSFKQLITSANLTEHFDLGCILEHGAYTREILGGKVQLLHTAPEEALISFFLTLVDKLQALGTVPALDVGAYTKALNGYK